MHPAKPSTHSAMEGDKQKQLVREVKDMVNVLTHGITGTTTKNNNENDEADNNGVNIITLAGTNAGATFRTEFGNVDKSNINNMNPHEGMLFGAADDDDDEDGLSTHVNSNFQSVNNSIMFGSSYTTNDPGVHMEICRLFDNLGGYRHHDRPTHKRKGKKKEREYFKSDHRHSQQSD